MDSLRECNRFGGSSRCLKMVEKDKCPGMGKGRCSSFEKEVGSMRDFEKGKERTVVEICDSCDHSEQVPLSERTRRSMTRINGGKIGCTGGNGCNGSMEAKNLSV